MAVVAPVHAQTFTGPLTIQAAVDYAVAHNPDVRAALLRRESSQAGLIAGAAPFAWQPNLFVNSRRDSVYALSSAPSGAQLELQSGLGMSRIFRSGVGVSGAMTLARSGESSWGDTTDNTARLNLGVTVPMTAGGGAHDSAVREREADYSYRASSLDARQVVSDVVARTVVAFWRYQAAERRAAVQRQAEARSERMVEETAILVAADERARSDMDAMRAALAGKRASRAVAEQDVRERRRDLAIVMGLPAIEVSLLVLSPASFPSTDASALPPALSRGDLLAEALAGRADLAAATTRARGAEIVRDGARMRLVPRLDLTARASWVGGANGGALGRFLSPFQRRLGSEVAVEFTYTPTVTSDRHAFATQMTAAARQSAIAAEDLTRQISLEIDTSLDGLATSRDVLADANEAVRQSQLVLETEQTGFKLGFSTLFDFILAEEKLTSALMTALSAEVAHAEAIVRVQQARGLLVDVVGDRIDVDPSRALSVTASGSLSGGRQPDSIIR